MAKKNRRPGQDVPTPDSDHYISEGGEHIPEADYERWIERGKDALSVLDPDFGDDDDPDNAQNKLNDLLCHLRHVAQALDLDFVYAIENSYGNYEAEKRPNVPAWAKE